MRHGGHNRLYKDLRFDRNAGAGARRSLLLRDQDVPSVSASSMMLTGKRIRNMRSMRRTGSVRPRLSMPRSRSRPLDKEQGAPALAAVLAHAIAHQRDGAASAGCSTDLGVADGAFMKKI
jgi:hypothetical protein